MYHNNWKQLAKRDNPVREHDKNPREHDNPPIQSDKHKQINKGKFDCKEFSSNLMHTFKYVNGRGRFFCGEKF